LLQAFVDIFPFEINERKLWLPFDQFGDGMQKLLPPALPTSTEELDIVVAASKVLTIGNEGAVSNYLRYNSPELQSLRRSIGLNFKTVVKMNPEDLDLVHVQDPVSKGWLSVPSCMPEYTSGLSIVQHRAVRDHLRGELERRKIPEQLAQAKRDLMDLWNSQSMIGKKLKMNQIRGLSGLTSTHALRGEEKVEVKAPRVQVEQLVTKNDLRQAGEEIPTFESFDLL